MSDNDLVWQSPSEAAIRAVRKTPYTDIAEALQGRPGQWARLPGERGSGASAKNLAQNIRKGTMRDFAKNQFEAVVDGLYVFARYVGPGDFKPDDGEEVPPNGQDDVPVNGQAAIIRAWALDQGYELAERGRLPQDIVMAYRAAHE